MFEMEKNDCGTHPRIAVRKQDLDYFKCEVIT